MENRVYRACIVRVLCGRVGKVIILIIVVVVSGLVDGLCELSRVVF